MKPLTDTEGWPIERPFLYRQRVRADGSTDGWLLLRSWRDGKPYIYSRNPDSKSDKQFDQLKGTFHGHFDETKYDPENKKHIVVDQFEYIVLAWGWYILGDAVSMPITRTPYHRIDRRENGLR